MKITDITPEMIEGALERTGMGLISEEWTGRYNGQICGCAVTVLVIDKGLLDFSEIQCSGSPEKEISSLFEWELDVFKQFLSGFDGGGIYCRTDQEGESYLHGKAIRKHFIDKGYQL